MTIERRQSGLASLSHRPETTAILLARMPLSERLVGLKDISLYGLPIDWSTATNLAEAVNRLKQTPLERSEVTQLKPDVQASDAVVWLASAIAHHYNPEISPIFPSEEEIEAIKPWLGRISHFVGRFSQRWQGRFERFVEGRAEKVITQTADKITHAVDLIGQVDRPRVRFVPELTGIYRRLSADRFEFVGSIETRVRNLIIDMRVASRGDSKIWLNIETYPLISRALEISKFPPYSLNEEEAAIVGSEIMGGVETFLRNQGVDDIETPPGPVSFDLFDLDTWYDGAIRGVVEIFAGDRIEAVRKELPNILEQVQRVLPEDGPAAVDSVRALVENILILRKQGVTNAEIVDALSRQLPG